MHSGASIELPRYKCHKKVWALKIKAIGSHAIPNPEFKVMTFDDSRYASIKMPSEWFEKHDVKPGGYYVVYADGYTSYSPAEAFEEGYSLDKGE